MIKRQIWVTFQRAGLHRYPAAPDDVNYLASTHRHLFKFKISISVVHNDRDIEFHQFLNWLEGLYQGTLTVDFMSCEMIAEDLISAINKKHPGRDISVEVSEDGECGAVLTFKA
jgi:hypothetical protein